MFRYILKRLLLIIPVIIGVAITIFTIMYFIPGDPAEMLMPPTATEAEVAAKRIQLGLNELYHVRLKEFITDLCFRFDLGTSYVYNTPVVDEIAFRFPRTLLFALGCMVIRILVGIPLGIIAAVHQDGWGDRFSMFVALIGVSFPDFWIALMLVLFFSLKLGWLPPYGVGGLQYYILPIISGSLGGIAAQARQTRSAMVEVIRSDYVTTARSKGIPENRILYRHVLVNGMIPVIQVMGNGFGLSLAGAIVIENVFSIPGMGTYLTAAVANRDYPAVQGTVVVLAIAFSLVMLLVDLAFAFFDPRIKAQYEAKSSLFGKIRKRNKGRHGRKYNGHHKEKKYA